MTKYDDIINLPHPVSKKHQQMSLQERAAQFSPFAALTGYEAAIKETARETEVRIDLDETEKSVLDEKLRLALQAGKDCPELRITYFVPDERKRGGNYETLTGKLRRIDAFNHSLLLEDGRKIQVKDIYAIESSLFDNAFSFSDK